MNREEVKMEDYKGKGILIVNKGNVIKRYAPTAAPSKIKNDIKKLLNIQ